MGHVKRQMGYLEFGLEPIFEFVARLASAFLIELEGAGANLLLRRTRNHVFISCHHEKTLAHLATEATG